MTDKKILPDSNHFFEHMIMTTSDNQLQMDSAFLICFLLKGSCYVKCRNNTRHIHENNIFFFSPNTPFSFVCRGKSISYYQIRVTHEYIKTYLPSLIGTSFNHFHISEGDNPGFYQTICRQISHIMFSSLSDPITKSLQQLTNINIMLLSIYREFSGYLTDDPKHSDYVEERIQKILLYIEQHYSEKLRMEDISSDLGLHPQYFSAFFQKYFQEKFTNYLNQYRVNQSLNDLIHTDKSLLEIAIDHGFQSNKSYSNSFYRFYQEPPSSYRLRYREQQEDISSFTEQNLIYQANYLYTHYWDREWLSDRKSFASLPTENNTTPLSLEIDLNHAKKIRSDRRIRIIAIGSCSYLLQEDVYEKLKQVKQTCDFTHVHIRNIFNDTLRVYTETTKNQPLFFWSDLDRVIERIMNLGFVPIMEIGFMPEALSSGGTHLGYSNHPNMCYPKSTDLWKRMIQSFLKHYMSLYGNQVLNWLFDFWNTGNICSDAGYWNDTQERFFDFYKATWEAFQSVHPKMKLGTPNFSLPDGFSWYEAFFDFCAKEQIRPSHFSVHLYSCMDDLEHFAGIFPTPPTTYNYLSLTTRQYMDNMIFFIKQIMKKHHLEQLPLIISEWNITFFLTDLIRDTAFMSSYIAHTYIQTMSQIDGLGYFSLSDINDQSLPSELLFAGDFGLFDRHGIPKPTYHAFTLLHQLGKDVITQGENYIVTRSLRGYQIMIYNMNEYETGENQELLGHVSHNHRYQVFQQTLPIRFQGILHVPQNSYHIREYSLDRDHGSCYDAWHKMGCPDQLTTDITDYLIRSSYPALHCSKLENTSLIMLDGTVNPHGILLYMIEPLP